VLGEIEEEQNRTVNSEVVDCMPDLEIKSDHHPVVDDYYGGNPPIESLYQPPLGGHGPQVLVSPGGHNIVCVSGGIRPFQEVRIADLDMRLFRDMLPTVAKALNESEQLKADELLENLERAAHASKDGEFMLSVVPLARWQKNPIGAGE